MTSTIKLRSMDELLSLADTCISRTRMLYRPEGKATLDDLLQVQLQELSIKLSEVKNTLGNRIFERKCAGEETF